MTNKEIALKIKETLTEKNIEKMIEIVRSSYDEIEAANKVAKEFGLETSVANKVLMIDIMNIGRIQKTDDILKAIYTSKDGEKAFNKICKDKKLNIIKTSLYSDKDYKKIYANPKSIYEIIDSKYKYMSYDERQKKLDSVYFQAFKNI